MINPSVYREVLTDQLRKDKPDSEPLELWLGTCDDIAQWAEKKVQKHFREKGGER